MSQSDQIRNLKELAEGQNATLVRVYTEDDSIVMVFHRDDDPEDKIIIVFDPDGGYDYHSISLRVLYTNPDEN